MMNDYISTRVSSFTYKPVSQSEQRIPGIIVALVTVSITVCMISVSVMFIRVGGGGTGGGTATRTEQLIERFLPPFEVSTRNFTRPTYYYG